MNSSSLIKRVLVYFDLKHYKAEEATVIEDISNNVAFRGANLWVLIFAIFIASLGLNVNSTAVIIGAMLISPLMGPILGMGLAVGINDIELLKRSFKNYTIATVISVITATVYFIISPLNEARSELLARTSPSLYDVLIAFCGGAAGIIAMCTKGKNNVIPGVAIATALMPPLCTAGYGLATGHLVYFLGAFYLFFINTVFICLATMGGVRLLRFRRKEFMSPETARKTRRIIIIIISITMIPAAIMTAHIVKTSIFERNVHNFIENELAQSGTQIIDNSINDHILRIVAVGKEIDDISRRSAEAHMDNYGLGKYALSIIQGAQSDSLILLNNQLSQVNVNLDNDRRQIKALTEQAVKLSDELDSYRRYETMSNEVSKEASVLFPQVRGVTLMRTATGQDSTYTVCAFVRTVDNNPMTYDDNKRLRQWLQTRTGNRNLTLLTSID